jgi:hypothetical protein
MLWQLRRGPGGHPSCLTTADVLLRDAARQMSPAVSFSLKAASRFCGFL